MNWGLKIVFGLSAFILFILGAGIYMVCKNTDTLEEDDYYERSLSYDEVYGRKQNLINDNVRPTVTVDKDTLYIVFQKEHNRGQLVFKRASDDKLDRTLPFAIKGRTYALPILSFRNGSWQLEISWERAGKSYLSDHRLYF